MDTITKEDVFPGDILLYHGNSTISRLIRFFDGTEVNHAAICIGPGRVGEALGKGLKRRTIDLSIRDSSYVIVRRLKADPGTMKPVGDRAGYYLDTGNRYGYEQIILLAFLGLTRRLHVNIYLKWLIRKILDQATARLMKTGKRQPMICSEFVYRCYDEALPVERDPYSLNIPPLPKEIKGLKPTHREGGAGDQLLHPDSLLAWSLDVMAGKYPLSTGAPPHSSEKGTPGKKRLSSEEKRLREISLDDLINRYLLESKRPADRSLELEASLRDREMFGSIRGFSEAFYSATKGTKAGDSRLKGGGDKGLTDSLAHLFSTMADFVTPGDLYRCPDLYTVAGLVPETQKKAPAIQVGDISK